MRFGKRRRTKSVFSSEIFICVETPRIFIASFVVLKQHRQNLAFKTSLGYLWLGSKCFSFQDICNIIFFCKKRRGSSRKIDNGN